MSFQITHQGFGFIARRSMPLQAPFASTQPIASARPDWMARLAAWAEKQPMHRRLGSYTRPR
jgi:hypothetical protein